MNSDNEREQLRRVYYQVWQKVRAQQPLEPLEALVSDVIVLHPEYHLLLEDEARAIGEEFSPDDGQTNPFLHMGMHVAIREQVQADRPAGIAALYRQLATTTGDLHNAEHRMMECLGEALWNAQRQGRPPDEQQYLDCLRRQL